MSYHSSIFIAFRVPNIEREGSLAFSIEFNTYTLTAVHVTVTLTKLLPPLSKTWA